MDLIMCFLCKTRIWTQSSLWVFSNSAYSLIIWRFHLPYYTLDFGILTQGQCTVWTASPAVDKFAKAEGLHKYLVWGLAALVKFRTDLLGKKKIINVLLFFVLPRLCVVFVFLSQHNLKSRQCFSKFCHEVSPGLHTELFWHQGKFTVHSVRLHWEWFRDWVDSQAVVYGHCQDKTCTLK